MSKKHRNNRRPKTTTVLKKDKFYNVHDGSKKGHPGIITKVDNANNEYQSVVTETNSNDGKNVPLKHPTDDKVEQSWVKPRPFLGAREDYGNKEYSDMKIHEDDKKTVDMVNKRKPIKGKWLKKKNPSN